MRSPGLLLRTTSVLCALLLFVSVSSATRTKRTASKSGATTHASSSTHKSSKSARSSHTTSSKGRKGSHSSAKSKKTASKGPRGQQGIDAERTTEIQAALIREKYLEGEPSGVFDQETKNALMKYQAANGWQTKVLPDSRALIKLGLGPSTNGLLNPESAAVSKAQEAEVEKEIPGGAVAAPRK